jgi:hypothetical protein
MIANRNHFCPCGSDTSSALLGWALFLGRRSLLLSFCTDDYANLPSPSEPVVEDRTDRKRDGTTKCCGCRFTQDVRDYVLRNLARESEINMVQGGHGSPRKCPVTGADNRVTARRRCAFFVMRAGLSGASGKSCGPRQEGDAGRAARPMPTALSPDEGMAVCIPVDRGAVDRIGDLVLGLEAPAG